MDVLMPVINNHQYRVAAILKEALEYAATLYQVGCAVYSDVTQHLEFLDN